MRETKTLEIEGRTYRITPLGARKGNEVLSKLLKLAGQSLKQSDFGSTKDLGLSEILSGIGSILENLQPQTINELMDHFSNDAMFEKEKTRGNFVKVSDHWDDVFSTNYFEQVMFIKTCVEVNFGFLLEKLKSQLGGLGEKTAEK